MIHFYFTSHYFSQSFLEAIKQCLLDIFYRAECLFDTFIVLECASPYIPFTGFIIVLFLY